MNRSFVILILISFFSCDNKKPLSSEQIDKTAEKPDQPTEQQYMNDRLKRYFENNRIVHSIEINNVTGDQTEIPLGTHTINWLNTENETKIKIDNDLFSLKDNVTLNVVWNRKDSVDFANNWRQIKLYKFNDKEFIGIQMTFSPCTGLGCSVDYYLIYDVTTKTRNFFGTFRTDNTVELFNFSTDAKIDYVSKTLNGDANGSTPIEFIYELYSMDKNGHFNLQTDSNGIAYQIKHTTFPNDTIQMTDKWTEHWIEKIK